MLISGKIRLMRWRVRLRRLCRKRRRRSNFNKWRCRLRRVRI